MIIDRVGERLRIVRDRIAERCLRNGVDPAGILIVGVTKTLPAEVAAEGVKAGLTDLGENRVQEAAAKIPLVEPRPRWHMVGHLQKNKAKKAMRLFDVIQSVDSIELARLLSRHAEETGKTMEIYLEVNSSYESSKSGFDPAEIVDAADIINGLPGLRLSGIMTVGPLTDQPKLTEKCFSLTRDLFEKMRGIVGAQFRKLSMGMSGDFELALDFGANVLRIGSAIFGPRRG